MFPSAGTKSVYTDVYNILERFGGKADKNLQDYDEVLDGFCDVRSDWNPNVTDQIVLCG